MQIWFLLPLIYWMKNVSYLNVTGAIGQIGVGALLPAEIVPEKEDGIDPKLEVNCARQQKKKK